MNFGEALEAVKEGRKASRAGWNGKGMFIFLVAGSRFAVNRPPLLGIYPEGLEISYNAHIDIKNPDGSISTWSPSNGDALAEDWAIHGLKTASAIMPEISERRTTARQDPDVKEIGEPFTPHPETDEPLSFDD